MAARLYTLSRAHAHAHTRIPHRSEVVIAHKGACTRLQESRIDGQTRERASLVRGSMNRWPLLVMMCTWQTRSLSRWNVRGQRGRTWAGYVGSCVVHHQPRVCQGGLITSLELPYKLSRDEPTGVRNGARVLAFVEVLVMVNRPHRLIDILRRKIPPVPRLV